MGLHDGHRKRLKEQFLHHGDGFHDHQLLELLLCYAIPQGDVNGLAHRLLDRFGSLAGVLDARPEALEQVPGVGEHTAVLLKLLPVLSAWAPSWTPPRPPDSICGPTFPRAPGTR